MQTLTIVLIAILIILVIFFAYRFFRAKPTAPTGPKIPLYEELLQSSYGAYDDYAKKAMDELRRNREGAARAEEHFRRANILQHNYFGNEWRRLRAEPRVLSEIARDYQGTLQDIRDGNIAGFIPIDFMIGQIETFALEGINELAEGRAPNTAGLYVGIDNIPHLPDEDFERILPMLENILNAVPQARRATVEQRLNEAHSGAQNKLEAIDTYLDKSQSHTSDGENVHDSSVNIALRNTISKIKRENRGNERMEGPEYEQPDQYYYRKDEVINAIRAHLPDIAEREGKRAKLPQVMRALDHIVKTRSFVSSLGDNEENILVEIWKRAGDPRNAANGDKIKAAVFDALADMGDPAAGTIVCVNGRAGRLIEALTLLDFDKDIGKAQTTESYRNEIFSEVKRAIDLEIDRALEDKDPCLKAAARAYKEVLNKAEQKLADDGEPALRARLNNVIDGIIRSYDGQVEERDLNTIKNECLAAL